MNIGDGIDHEAYYMVVHYIERQNEHSLLNQTEGPR
jgi:hypothetical protein